MHTQQHDVPHLRRCVHHPGCSFEDAAQNFGPLYVHQGEQRCQLNMCQQRLRPNDVMSIMFG